MKKILIVAHFSQTPNEIGNGRFHYLANLLHEEKYDVKLLTSSFSHRNKLQRNINNEKAEGFNYKIDYAFEPSYKKNVSFKRIFSHFVFSLSVSKYLNSIERPDLLYIAIPSLRVAYKTIKYSKKHKIPFILDIQDLWPESFLMVFNIPFLSNIIFFPMKKRANFIYKNSENIIAVSQTYLDRANSVKNNTNGMVVYLGTDLQKLKSSQLKSTISKGENEIWIIYIGTLGNSYDIKLVIDAIKKAENKTSHILKFYILGDGPLKSEFIDYAKSSSIQSFFLGRLSYDIMMEYLYISDIAVNPIRKGSAGSIINKVADYAAAGLPVINSQENLEYRQLIEQYNAGINVEPNNAIEFSDAIIMLANDETNRKKMGKNNFKSASEVFDRGKTYKKIIKNIENILLNKVGYK